MRRFVLRAPRRREARDHAWWNAARARHDAPPAIAALLAGRNRVEVTRDEAMQALVWAADVDGWDATEHRPLTRYPTPDALDASR